MAGMAYVRGARAIAFSLALVAGCGEPSAPAPLDGAPLDGTPDAADAALPPCTIDSDCDDGAFCTGVEVCDAAASGADARGCVTGTAPCAAGATCDETTDSC